MSNYADAAQEYARKFTTQKTDSDAADRWLKGSASGVLLILIAVGLGLEAEPGVWLFASGIIGLPALLFLWEIRKTRAAFGEALTHLGALGDIAHQGADIADYLRLQRTAEDESHVPESISAFVSSRRSVEAIQSTAEGCFIYPSAKLSRIGYFRTLLVLAGLFGTVLFFGLGLQDVAEGVTQFGRIDVSTLGPFVADLKGALACTLLGICSSAIIAVMAGMFQRELDLAIIETEAFLAEVVHPALVDKSSEFKPDSEADLWLALQLEVRRMTTKINDRYDQLAAQRERHLRGFDDLVNAISNLPQTKFPDGWEDLSANLESFSSSVRRVENSVNKLIELRADELRKIQDESMGIMRMIQDAVTEIRHDVSKLEPIAEETSELTTKIAELAANSEEMGTKTSRMGTSIDKVVKITGSLETNTDQQSELLGSGISELTNRSDIVGKELEGVREKVSAIWSMLSDVNELDAGAQKDTRLEILQKLRVLDERLETFQGELSKVKRMLNKPQEFGYQPPEESDTT